MRAKVKKLLDQGKGDLTSERKAALTRETKHSFCASHWLACDQPFPGKRVLSMCSGCLRRQKPSSQTCFLLPPFLELMLLKVRSCSVEYLFGQGCHVPSQPLPCPPPTLCWQGERNPPCFTNAAQRQLDTGALSALIQPQMESKALCRLLWHKLTPSQPDTVQILIYNYVNSVFPTIPGSHL